MQHHSANRFKAHMPARLESHPAIIPDADRIREYAAELVEILKKTLQLQARRIGDKVNLADAIRNAPAQKIYESYKALRGATLPRYLNGNSSDLATLLRLEMLNYLETTS